MRKKTAVSLLMALFILHALSADGSVDVLAFGADPSGAADCSDAFDAALQALLSDEGKNTLYLPNGRYRFTRTFYIHRVIRSGGVRWFGPFRAGRLQVVGESRDGVVIEGDLVDAFIWEADARVSIRDLSFCAKTDNTCSGLYINQESNDSEVADCLFYGLKTGLRIGPTAWTARLENLDFMYCGHKEGPGWVFEMENRGHEMANNATIRNLRLRYILGDGALISGQGVAIDGLQVEIGIRRAGLAAMGVSPEHQRSMIGLQFNTGGCVVNGAYIETDVRILPADQMMPKLKIVLNDRVAFNGSLFGTGDFSTGKGVFGQTCGAIFTACKFNALRPIFLRNSKFVGCN